jgi:hypothetical protein
MEYRVFNTGDQIWISQRHGNPTVVKALTHDGLTCSEDEPTIRRLEGAERIVHQVTVFFMRLILKALA